MTIPDEPLAAGEQRPSADQAAPDLTVQPRLRVRFGLAGRLSLALLSAAALVFSAAFYYDYRESRQHLLDGVGETIAGLSGAITGQLQGVLADVTAIATELAQAIKREADFEVLRGVAVEAIMDCSHGLGTTVVIRSGEKVDPPDECQCFWLADDRWLLSIGVNAAGECFGADRLLRASRLGGTANPRRLVGAVVAAVAAHVQAAEPSDDLTLLAVARIGDANTPAWEAQSP